MKNVRARLGLAFALFFPLITTAQAATTYNLDGPVSYAGCQGGDCFFVMNSLSAGQTNPCPGNQIEIDLSTTSGQGIYATILSIKSLGGIAHVWVTPANGGCTIGASEGGGAWMN